MSKRKTLRERSNDYAFRLYTALWLRDRHGGTSSLGRRGLEKGWLAGYRAAKRDGRKS